MHALSRPINLDDQLWDFLADLAFKKCTSTMDEARRILIAGIETEMHQAEKQPKGAKEKPGGEA